jgi:predicted RNA-binding protein with PUA-like domain
MYWILKSEPNDYSFEDLARDKKTMWTGVRNYQARNNLKLMAVGDKALIYHSVGPKSLVGLASVTKTAEDEIVDARGEWVMVELKYEKFLKRPVSLDELKSEPGLRDLILIKQGRLSVSPVTPKQWQTIAGLAETELP